MHISSIRGEPDARGGHATANRTRVHAIALSAAVLRTNTPGCARFQILTNRHKRNALPILTYMLWLSGRVSCLHITVARVLCVCYSHKIGALVRIGCIER